MANQPLPDRRRLAADDLYRLSVPSDPQLSPDGSRVAYVVTVPDRDEDGYRTTIWLAATDGSGCRQLTAGAKDRAPRWSPDGTTIAFLAVREPAETAQVHILPMAGGDAIAVTSLPLGAGAPVWSPDGTHVAFTAPVDIAGETDATAPVVIDRLDYKADGAGLLRTRRSHLFVADARPGAATLQLTWGDWSVAGPAWSPDGKTIVVAGMKDLDRDLDPTSVLYAVPVDGGAPERLGDGPLSSASFTPDGQEIVCAGSTSLRPGHARLFAVGVVDGERRALAPTFDRNVMVGAPGYPGAQPQLAGSTVLFCARDRGCSHVYSVPLDGSSAPRKIVGGSDRTVAGMSTSADRLAFVAATAASPGEVFVVGVDGSVETQLTDLAVGDVELFTPSERTFVAPDGTQIHGWVLRDESAATPGPLLLDIHGGPHNAWSPVFDGAHLYHQLLAAQGWTVLFVNPRGSDGYGEDFYRAVVFGWGTNDRDDFLCAVDALVAEGVADNERLAVTGYSYGGYMTCKLTAGTDRFAAAVAGGAVTDLAAEFGTADLGWYLGAFEIGGTPTDAPDAYARQSPIGDAGAVQTPTLLLHGENDQRCPVSQAEAWFAGLRTRRVECELVRYPGASHLFIVDGRPSHRIDYSTRVVDWVTTHVAGSAAPRLARRLAGYQARFDDLARRHRVPGASLAVLDGEEIVEFATGVVSLDSGQPVVPEARFQIGSITKLFTATLVMQLVERGQVELDAPVQRYVPAFALADTDAAKSVTVRHLLTHTSGIPGDHFLDTGRGTENTKRYVDSLAALTPVHPVGAMFSYSNAAFALAGHLVEQVTGMAWADALDEMIVRPLGLSMKVHPEDVVMSAHAVGHLPESGGALHVASRYSLPTALNPAGSSPAATARDLLLFARMHLDGGGGVLSGATVKEMQERQVTLPAHFPSTGWGLGWSLGSFGDDRVIGHNGGTLGQYSNLSILPDRRIAIAILTNSLTGPLLGRDVWRDLFGELAGVQPPGPLVPAQSPPEVDLSKYAGVYETISTRASIEVTDGALVLQLETLVSLVPAPAPHPITLAPLDETTFVMPDGSGIMFMEPDAQGRFTYVFTGRVARRV